MPLIFILMGIKHCGKTTIGRLLSGALEMDFIDLDYEVEKQYSPDRKVSFREVYCKVGRMGFAQLETAALKKLYTEVSKPLILSLGGGTIENKRGVEILKQSGLKIYLKEEESTLYERILSNGLPPFLDSSDPRQQFHALYLKRDSMYTALADLTVKLVGKNPVEAAAAVRSAITTIQGAHNGREHIR